jgi:UDP-2,3-diacylglucosamine hydrolase
VLPSPVLVLGDVHLGIAPADAEQDLLRLLRDAPRQARSLVIMGDLFDFWFAWEHAMPRTGFRVLAALAELHDTGFPVLWMGGNHDCWGGPTLEAMTGARYTLEPWEGHLGAWHVRLAHGDGLREVEDRPYRRLRTVLRHPLAINLYGRLHPNWASRLALRSSHTSRDRRPVGDEGRGLLAVAASWMQRATDPELVIFGHSHVPALTTAGSGVYANAGAWYLDRQFLRITDDAISHVQWDGSAEGHVLHVIERQAKEPPAEREKPIGGV